MSFIFLDAKDIDRRKWMQCVDSGPLNPIYICDWYLDAAAGNWSALICGDYDAVLPVAKRKKWGIDYLYQPFFTRNMFIAGNCNHQEMMEQLALSANHFKLWDFSIECHAFDLKKVNVTGKLYQELVLSDYDEVYSNYAGNLKRSIRDASKEGIEIRQASDPKHFATCYKKYTGHRIPEFYESDFERLANVMDICMQKTNTIFLSAFKGAEELSSAFFARRGNKIIYIEGFSSPEGRKLQSMHLLFDTVIRNECSRGFVLDFGGSNVRSIAHFFHAFGGKDKGYYSIKKDELPAAIRLIRSLKGRHRSI